MKLKLVLGSLMLLGLLAGCSKGEVTAKTEEEIRQEVKAELEQEMKDDLKNEIKEEVKNELVQVQKTDSEPEVVKEAPAEKSASSSNILDVSSVEPYVTSNLIFSNFSLEKHSDGYSLEMRVENKNEEFDVAFGWGRAGIATLETSEGRFKAEFPHMEKIGAGQEKIYSFKFANAAGTPNNLVISNVLLVNQHDGRLPTPGSDEEFTISLK